MMKRLDKEALVGGVSTKLRQSQSVILTDFKTMTVAEFTALRTQLREHGIEMRVVKNRLLRRAIQDVGFDSVDDCLTGNTAVTYGIQDPGAPARILTEYAKKNAKLVIKGGLLEGKRLDPNGVMALSKMPGRRELLSIMAGDLKQPAGKMARVFQASLLKVAYAMQALAKKQDGAAAA